jgi:oligosaccharyltransferase complex subunit beta
MIKIKYLLFLSLCLTFVYVTASENKRVLVLVDHLGIRESHSTYFKLLKDNGFQLTIKTADDASLSLSKYGEYLYENLVLFSPSVAEFGGNISSKAIIDFIDAGGNVLVAANSDISEPIREIAGECGIEFSDEKTYVIDRFNSDVNDDGRNTLIAVDTDNLISNKLIVGNSKYGAPLLYKGIGMTAESENPLLLNVLTASSTAFTYKLDEKLTEYPHSVGKLTLLISALQARNNARVVFIGSLDFFSNSFFDASVEKSINGKKLEKCGNEDLSVALSLWAFKEKGVLRVKSISHHKANEKSAPNAYTINENIVYTIEIEEYSNGKWGPFKGDDVQLEFVRLDPFVRQTLINKNGKLEARFKVPDVYGIFKFVVEYNRVGYTHLFTSTQVSVRPLEHTQYERFIPAAFPYYLSSFSMIITVFFFSFIMLYHRDQAKLVKKD